MRAHRRLMGALAAAALVVALTGCGGDDEATDTTTTVAPATTTTGEPTTDEPTTTTEEEASEVRAYFMRGEEVGPVAREARGVDVAHDAMEGLLGGPTPEEVEIGLTTSIPNGTSLLDLDVDDGLATVDLSGDFASGGGTLSMTSRVAQVVFTLTQFPTIDEVAFRLDGEPVEALGGEGIPLDEPQSRADWEDLSPAILVESPLPFAEVTSPLRVSGTANTFEAVFQLNVVDGAGAIVYDEHQMATSGTGTRGTFDVTATFEVTRPGQGAVIAFVYSPKDGSRIDIVEIPVLVS